MEQRKVLDALSALASETRLDLVRMLVPAGKDGRSAGDLARALGVSASRLSFHLAALEQAGLVTSRRESRNVFYAADHGGIGRTFGWLIADCCCGHPEVRACCGWDGAAEDVAQDAAQEVGPPKLTVSPGS
ncbi:metalloregulator ArsR/SmtB family transcription factor [Frigidibacter sp. MR17.14]|uniref:ArsR/SmtB family transcription factor n=1 Tax=Frigidibacter sp. MR17.14 TaxID=3126509 RepID=UPI003012F091